MAQTNPRYKSFTQAIITVGDDVQFEELLPRKGIVYTVCDLSDNMFNNRLTVLSWDQIYIEKYNNLTSRDVYNTFAYIFYKFKKGIFSAISDGYVAAFLPFSNIRYRNEWSHLILVDNSKYSSVNELLTKSSQLAGYSPQKVLPLDEWVANDGMFSYESPPKEDDNNVAALKDMIETASRERELPDLEFYINSRVFPLLKQDNTEPYFNLYGSTTFPLVSHYYEKYAPIFSCSTAFGYADLPIPTYEDWARIQWQKSNITFPHAHRQYPVIVSPAWHTKKNVAVFRGSSTGMGTSPATNQRLRALEISQSAENAGRLDAGITSWNLRVRKHATSRYLDTIRRKSYPVANKLSLQEQSEYKYILTLEGHVAAYRLSYELSSGSVILLADSKWKMWFYSFLKPYVHYVPIKEDLSDLLEKIDWCRENDDKCKDIATAAKLFYDEYLNEKGVLDYIQKLFVDVQRSVGEYTWLPNLVDLSISYEEKWITEQLVDTSGSYNYALPIGPRCIGRLDACRAVLMTKTNLKPVKTIFKSSSVIVELIETNGFQVARKTPIVSPSKSKEHIHEVFIGLNAVNTLVAKCPNFAYTHGRISGCTYTEYIAGQTMNDWLLSSQYNIRDYISILLQLNLALATAQNYNAFIHYDLYPWNIVLQTLRDAVPFDYNIGNGIVCTYTTKLIPIIIDYGKSRAVVYDKTYGLIDSGYMSLYRAAKSLDTLTLLYSSMNVLGSKLLEQEVQSLLIFSRKAGVAPEKSGWSHIKWMSKYGNLINYINNNVDPLVAGPVDFVTFLQHLYPDNRLQPGHGLSLKTEKGYPWLELQIMKSGNEKASLLDTILKINRQMIPVSSNAVEAAVIKSLLKRRLADLDERVAKTGDDYIKRKYEKLRNYITNTSAKVETNIMTMNFPAEEHVTLDSQLTPDFIDEYSKLVHFNGEDWLTIWALCSEAALTNPDLDIFDTKNYDAFVFFNQVASNNTVLAIHSRIENIKSPL